MSHKEPGGIRDAGQGATRVHRIHLRHTHKHFHTGSHRLRLRIPRNIVPILRFLQVKVLTAAGQGATKAHRIHLRHVTKQFRATEKRLAQLLANNTGAFLKALGEVRAMLQAEEDPLVMMGFLLESTDGKPYQVQAGDEVRPGTGTFCWQPVSFV